MMVGVVGRGAVGSGDSWERALLFYCDSETDVTHSIYFLVLCSFRFKYRFSTRFDQRPQSCLGTRASNYRLLLSIGGSSNFYCSPTSDFFVSSIPHRHTSIAFFTFYILYFFLLLLLHFLMIPLKYVYITPSSADGYRMVPLFPVVWLAIWSLGSRILPPYR